MEKEIAAYNLKINSINASMSMTAQEKNQAIAAEKAKLTQSLVTMRQQIEDANDMAKSQNYNNFLTNLGNIGRENFIMHQVNDNPAYYYSVDKDGHIHYKNGYWDLGYEDRRKITEDAIKNGGKE